MEMEKVLKGVSKYATETMELFADIKQLDEKDVNEKFKEKYKNWQEYLELYQKCKKITTGKLGNDYIASLKKYENLFNIAAKENDNLEAYAKELTDACDETGDLIAGSKTLDDTIYNGLDNIVNKIKDGIEKASDEQKTVWATLFKLDPEKVNSDKLMGAYNDNLWAKFKNVFGLKNGKSVFLGALNDQRKAFAEARTEITTEFATVKSNISKAVGILSTRSIKRNVLQSTKNAPLRILKELYDSLKDNKNLPKYKGKDILKMKPKTFDMKVKNSMQKVVNCKWEEYEKLRENIGIKNLPEKVENLKNVQTSLNNTLKARIEQLKDAESGDLTHILNNTEEVCKAAKSIPDSYNKNENELGGFLANVFAYKMGCKIIFQSLQPLAATVTKEEKLDIDTIIGRTMVDKNDNTTKVLLLVLQTASVLLTFVPAIGGLADVIADVAKDITDLCKDSIDFTKDIIEAASDK